MTSNFQRPYGGSNLRPLDPKLNSFNQTRPQIHILSNNQIIKRTNKYPPKKESNYTVTGQNLKGKIILQMVSTISKIHGFLEKIFVINFFK